MLVGRFLRALMLLTMLLAPIGMTGRSLANPHQAQASMPPVADGHCPDMDREGRERQPGSDASCMIACSALPAVDPAVPLELPAVMAPLPVRLFGNLHGLSPEADPPPPRMA